MVLLMVLNIIINYRSKKVFDKRIKGMNDMIDAFEKKQCGPTIAKRPPRVPIPYEDEATYRKGKGI